MFRSVVRTILFSILTIQLCLGSSPFSYAQNPGDGTPRTPSELANQLSEVTAENGEHVQLWSQAANAIESGSDQLPNQDKNPLSLGNQRVEIIGGRTYSFNDYHVEIPAVSITGLRVLYDEKNRELILEGLRGQNDRGEAGSVVARHYIQDVDVGAMVKDEELLSIVDSKGSLHVVSMDYVAKNIFSSPIPVFKNLWSPEKSLEGQKLAVHYATPGLRPPQFKENQVLPRDEKGNVRIESGDLFLYQGTGNQKELVGAFSRKVTYEKMIRGFKSLLQMVIQIYPANVDQSLAKTLVTELENLEVKGNGETDPNTMPETLRRALLHISQKQVQSMRGSIDQQKARAQRQYHLLIPQDWQKTFDELQSVARTQSEKLGIQVNGNLESDAAYQKSQLDSLLEAGDLASIWKNLYEQSTLMPTTKVTKKQREWVKKAKEYSFKYLAPVFVVGAAFGFPYAFEQIETMQQIKTLAWMYENAIPAVVKDAEYRIPLLASTVSLLALWPGSVAISYAMGRGLRVLAAAFSKSTSRAAQIIRDVSKQWSPLSNWQRITSFGMRFYGTLIYPILQTIINKGLRQPTMVTAWNRGLNPFQSIAPDSSVGRQLRLQESLRVGVLNPFSRGQNAEQARDTQLQIQSVLAERQNRIENLSWKLATLVVGEKEKIDPATIELVASGKLDTSKLESIFSNTTLQKDWERTQHTIYKYLEGLGDGYFDQDAKEMSKEMVAKHFAYAQEIAQKIKQQDPRRRTIEHLWHQSRNGLKKSRETLFNLGVADSQFLKTVFTNKYVSEQTEKGFVSDHLMVVLIMAFIGERADLNHPGHLAADPNGLASTSGPHWSDVGTNTYVHFFVAGSKRALVFQSVKPEDSSTYEPAEYLWANNLERREGAGRTAFEWVRNVVDPRKSNMGHYAVKAFVKRLTTIQAALAMTLLFRMGLGDQGFGDAMMGWLVFFFAGQWYYGWPWDIIDRGTHLEGERIDEMKLELRKTFAMVSQGLREPNEAVALEKVRVGQKKLMALMQKYNPKALELMTKSVSDAGFQDLVQQYRSTFNPETMKNLAQMVRLHMAIQSKDAEQIILAKNDLKNALAGQGVLSAELDKLNANALLEFSFKNSPVFTEAHPSASWVAVFGLGAVLTTILAIPLSVLSFDPNYLNWGTVAFWAAVSSAGYYLYHKTLTKDGWVAQGLNKIDAWWAEKKKEKAHPAVKTLTLKRACADLFLTQ